MTMVGPPQTLEDLGKSARRVRDGRATGLPAVKSDIEKMHDAHAEEANRKLEKAISRALARYKPEKDAYGEPLFILGWRLYPNKNNEHWKEAHEHTCGCSCGGTAPWPPPGGGGDRRRRSSGK
jgi:hypothetical protein